MGPTKNDFSNKTSQFVKNPLAWPSASRALFIVGALFVVLAYYLAVAEYLVCCSTGSSHLDLAYINDQLGAQYSITAAAAIALVLIRAWYRWRGDHLMFEYIAGLLFCAGFAYLSYLTGPWWFGIGAILVAAPVAGYLLLSRQAVFSLWLLMLFIHLVLAVGAAFQWWPEGPLFLSRQMHQGDTPDVGLPWLLETYALALPPIMMLLSMSYVILRRWRLREDRSRAMHFTDPLTGLFNRRSILSHLRKERARSFDGGPVLSVLLVDLDHLKQVNDSRGHEAGDFALLATADALQQCLRQNDRVGRFGGDQFLVVLPGTDLIGARVIAERCRYKIENLRVSIPESGDLSFSASFGAACNEGDVLASAASLVNSAESALQQAKDAGRNRVFGEG